MTTKSIAWNTGGGNITLTYQGQGNGTITAESDANPLGSSRSQTITVETVGGAITRNLTISQAACPFPVGDVKNYAYTGSYQTVELPAGKYRLQCWGAQGGSNGTNSTYGITAQAGGKGGYSEGIITLSQKTTMRVYVGGQGSATAGGFNGGGSTTGTSQYNASNELGYSKMGGGGGATDIRLSDGALLSRMIVAGGGSGGSMFYKKTTSTQSDSVDVSAITTKYNWINSSNVWVADSNDYYGTLIDVSSYAGWTCSMTKNSSGNEIIYAFLTSWDHVPSTTPAWATGYSGRVVSSSNVSVTVPTDAIVLYVYNHSTGGNYYPRTLTFTKTTTSTSTKATPGRVGGGVEGGSISSVYAGTQNSAGLNASFGQGANQTTSNRRYVPAAGGGGWYGGGNNAGSNTNMDEPGAIGGGSGFVNTAASASNRPSGYTGLQLDSGETKDGNTSFPSTSGGNETGHSGNGYAKITRLA